MQVLPYIAEANGGGLSALGLNVQSFLFQLITFVIVLLILRKYAFGRIVSTLDARRKAVTESIKNAEETEKRLKNAEQTVTGILADARKEADEIIAASHKEATQLVEEAERKAAKRAEHIVTEAKAQFDVEVDKARAALKAETARLVATATERIIQEKIDPAKDAALMERALQNAKEPANG